MAAHKAHELPHGYVLKQMLASAKLHPMHAPAADAPLLADMLKTASATPSSTSVAAVPSSVTADELAQLRNIQLLESFVGVVAMKLYYDRHDGKAPDITSPSGAAQFIKDSANAKFEVISKSLGGFLNMEKGVAYEYHKSQTSAEFHAGFLGTLFKSFSFPAATMAELDGILTSVNETLSNLKLSFSEENSSLDHLIFFYFFEEVPGLSMKIAKLRLYYLHIDHNSWTANVGKNSIQHIQFDVNYFDYACTMDSAQVDMQKQGIQDIITKLTGTVTMLP
jgi:hypothetical protein